MAINDINKLYYYGNCNCHTMDSDRLILLPRNLNNVSETWMCSLRRNRTKKHEIIIIPFANL